MGVTLYGDWGKAHQVFTRVSAGYRQMIEKALKQSAMEMANVFTEGLMKGKFDLPPLKPATIAAKGSSLPLVDTGQLAKAHTYKRISWNVFGVGVFRTTKHKGSSIGLVNLAAVHYAPGSTLGTMIKGRGGRAWRMPKRDPRPQAIEMHKDRHAEILRNHLKMFMYGGL